jgi:hypothetical protein
VESVDVGGKRWSSVGSEGLTHTKVNQWRVLQRTSRRYNDVNKIGDSRIGYRERGRVWAATMMMYVEVLGFMRLKH